MRRRLFLMVVLAAALPSQAVARPDTAAYAGVSIRDLKVEGLVASLKSEGAFVSKQPLYQMDKVKRSGPSRNPATDKLYDYLDSLSSLDLLGGESDIRMRKPIGGAGVGEVLIKSCPADGSVSHIGINYPRAVQTLAEFAKLTRELTTTLGKSPTKTSRSQSTLIVDWDFQDSTMVRAIFNGPEGRAMGSIAPISVNYLGSLKARSCNMDFRRGL